MSDTTYATVSDVATELGKQITEDSVEARQITRWINRTVNLIRLHIPVLDSWCEDEQYRLVVNDVIVNTVARKARNPEGMYSQTISADDASVTKTMSTSAGTLGEIVITDTDWDLLLKRVSGGISSIDPILNPEEPVYPRYPLYS
ncbi:hypothetical protein CYJ32_07435 [Alloscardovia omnicolens]|jgi:hypothetical protein|uniref:Phage gp6-like head-tail connector protein n=1 Tax=Alloscardovia omnicolens TaxID=419015 RepID=A0A2I1M1T7_9BIFI|nr:Gp19/Gp15/Gp42 family protein [Alloscardovia omnicolens]PKZ14049.1 hypothetical protein CYJ32_07435 [Alloscardovia omnicolens]